MTKSIAQLLKKKTWKGEELGKLMFMSMIHDLETRMAGKQEALFPPGELNRIASIVGRDDWQWRMYMSYCSLYDGFVHAMNQAEGQKQQFEHGKWRLTVMTDQIRAFEVEYGERAHSPVVMTRKQYNRLRAKVTRQKREEGAPLIYVLFHILDWYIKCGKPTSALPKRLVDALESIKKEPCTNKRILDTYRYNRGEWELEESPNGEPEKMPDGDPFPYLAKGMFLLTPAKERKHLAEYIVGKAMRDGVERTLTDEEQAFLDTHLKGKRYIYRCPPPPADLNKYDALWACAENYFGIFEVRYDYTRQVCVEDVSPEEQFMEFQADYPKLYKALLAYVKKVLPDSLTDGLDPLNDELATWGTLADAGLEKYAWICEADKLDILREYQGEIDRYNANSDEGIMRVDIDTDQDIAILEGTSAKVDAKGEYPFKTIEKMSVDYMTLEGIPGHKHTPKALVNNIMGNALRFIYALIAIADAVEDVYGVEGLGSIMRKRMDIDRLEVECWETNTVLASILTAFEGSPAFVERKREAYLKMFRPINADTFKPAKEDVEWLREELAQLRARRGTLSSSSYFYHYLDRLTHPGKTSG